MPTDKKKKIMHKFRMKEISAVDGMAQGGAKMVLMKRDTEDPEELAKIMFNDALEGLELQEDIDEATRGMWQYNEALRRSIREIMEDKKTYPDTMSAVRESLQEFASAVSSMIENAVEEIEEGAEEEVSKEKPMKTEGSNKFPATDYAYVPDPKKPSTWKLRLTSTPGGDPDQRIVGAAVAALGPGFRGQKVQIPSDDLAGVTARVRSAWLKANPDKGKEDLPKVLKEKKKKKEASAMPDDKKKTTEELEKSLEEKDTELKKVQDELEVVKAISVLTDAEKAHYNTLGDEEKASFLKLDADGRNKELEKLQASDPVVYTDEAGTEYKKSDDPRLVQMAKDRDEDRKLAKADREKSERLELEKRADADLKHLPGDQAVKVAVLKAVDGIEDEEVRKSAHEMLKAQNESHKGAFEEIGSRGEGFKKASDELDALAKKHAAENKMSYATAYDAVLKTEEGKKLYEQTLPQQQTDHQG